MKPPDVPFVRSLYGPTSPKHSAPGRDVTAIYRAISRAGFAPWQLPFTERYTADKVKHVKAFQVAHGIRATGNYGPATHDQLRRSKRKDHPTEWAFDAYSISIMEEEAEKPSPAEQAARQLVAAAGYWIVHRDQIHYRQARPFPLVTPPGIPDEIDCSGLSIDCFYAAGAPNPNGTPYDGLGYTVSLVGQGVQVPTAQAAPGCLVFYGHTSHPSPAFPLGSPTHVAVALGGGYVCSHGSESGPLKLPIGYRSDLHSVRRYELT